MSIEAREARGVCSMGVDCVCKRADGGSDACLGNLFLISGRIGDGAGLMEERLVGGKGKLGPRNCCISTGGVEGTTVMSGTGLGERAGAGGTGASAGAWMVVGTVAIESAA